MGKSCFQFGISHLGRSSYSQACELCLFFFMLTMSSVARASRARAEAEARFSTPGLPRGPLAQPRFSPSANPPQDVTPALTIDMVAQVCLQTVMQVLEQRDQQARSEAVAREMAAVDASAVSVEQARAAESAEQARAAELASRESAVATRDAGDKKLEQAKALSLLASQDSGPLDFRDRPQERDRRLRGGRHRKESRLTAILRTHVEAGDLTSSEFEEVERVLTMGAEVPSPSPCPSRTVWGAVGERGRSAPALYATWQQHGLAPLDERDTALDVFARDLKVKAAKEAKEPKKIASFEDFFKKMSAMKVLAPAAHAADAESYWRMDWHFKSVTHVFVHHGWPVAAEYHDQVVREWEEGFLEFDLITSTPEFQAGYFQGGLHDRALSSARLALVGGGKAGKAAKAAARKSAGTKDKVSATDTYCDYHKLYYPSASAHSSGTCEQKKKKAKG